MVINLSFGAYVFLVPVSVILTIASVVYNCFLFHSLVPASISFLRFCLLLVQEEPSLLEFHPCLL